MGSILRILGSARQLVPLYVGIIIGGVVVTATTLLVPFVIASATQRVVDMTTGQGGEVTDLVWLAVAVLALMLVNTLVTNATGYLGDVLSVRLRAILSHDYYAKLLRLPQRYFDEELTGTVISRLNRSITSITDFMQMFSNSFFTTLLTVVSVLVISAWHSPWLALLLLIIYPVFVWLTGLTSKRWQVWETAKNEHFDVAGGRFAEVVGQMRVVKSFLAERTELAHFDGHYDEAVALTKEQSRFWHRMDIARRAALDLVFFGVYLIIFLGTARGSFSVGSMVLLIQLVNIAKQPITSMSWIVDNTQRAITGSREYFKVMNEPDEPHHALAAEPDITWDLSDPIITFDDVSFGYDTDDLVLRDINLAVNRGQRVAFVGESGGGKTTLVNLVMKLYTPTTGTVRVAGHSVADVPTAALRREVGVVFQEASLFSGTVRENIAYGNPEATDDELRDAARRANALGFIDKLPRGLDTEIGERGVKLSGGQKQRIAVARALLKNAPILILDEATSSLDTKAERQVQAGLDELMQGRTTLVIAHRLSTISTVDVVVTIRDGRIDEIGSPAELATTGGIYAELLALQTSGTKADRARLRDYDISG